MAVTALTESEVMPMERREEGNIRRFDIHQIIQHVILMVSFIVLVATGLPLKFAASPVSQWWTGLWGGVDATRAAHHFAAYVMVFVCVYHVAYLVYNIAILKKPFPIKMIPNWQTFVNFFHEIMYFVGLRKEKPNFDRFNWREQFDYWAIFWGMPIMFISGFILMYPVLVTKLLPGWIVPASLIAHSDEATLALAWIFLVHIFFNHFTPGVFPLNKSIFTGKVPRERYQREHPLEYEQMVKAGEGNQKN